MEANYAAEFWVAVAECLVRFHRFEPNSATQATQTFWDRLRDTPQPETFRDIVYHDEPWSIACNLAGKKDARLRPSDWPAYESILKQHGLFPVEDDEGMSNRNN